MLQVTIIGNLGRDSELTISSKGTLLLRFTVGANYRALEDGVYAQKTEWVNVTVFGAQADFLAQRLVKGTRVYVDGDLQARPYLAQDQTARAGLQMIAKTVEVLTPRNDTASPAPAAAPARTTRPAAAKTEDLDSLPF